MYAHKLVLVYDTFICAWMLHLACICGWGDKPKNVHAQSVAKVVPHVFENRTYRPVGITAGCI